MARINGLLAATALGFLGMTGVALAEVPAFTTPEANLRAGPGRDYPFIAEIRPGTPVALHGCVGGYGWCDVDTEGLRGWIAADKLRILYGGRRVMLEHYAPEIAVPVITFDLGDYWGHYYPERPFYAERFRYAPELRQPGYGQPHETIIEHGGYPPPHDTIIEHGGYGAPHPVPGGEPGHEESGHGQTEHGAEPRPESQPTPTPPAHEHEHEHDHAAPTGTSPEPTHATPPSSTPNPASPEPHKHDKDKPPAPGGN